MQSWCFPCCFAGFKHELWRVNDLRQRPEKPMACVLQIAKQADYSPKQGPQNLQSGDYSTDMPSAPNPQASNLKVPTQLETDRPTQSIEVK
jgi:hypothetical protein